MNNHEFTTHIMSMRDKVFRFAHSILGDYEQARDLTQDLYEKLWLRRNELEKCNNIDAYVISSTKNLCLDTIRSLKVREREVLQRRHEHVEPLDGALESRDIGQVVERVIGGLPYKLKMVIHLRDVECYTIDEIADVMQIESQVVRVYLSRARKIVKEKVIKIMNYGI